MGGRAGDDLLGRVEPRLFTEPLRPLNRETSRGFAAIDFARYCGTPFLPWQEWLSVHALETLPDGRYRFRIVLVIVARQNGKSTWKRGITLFRVYLDGARLVVGLAQELSTANDQWQQTLDLIKEHPELSHELASEKTGNVGKTYSLTSGATYLTKAANRRAARGLARVAEVNFDELREQKSWAAWSAVSKTTTANPLGMVVAMSNAGDLTAVVLNQLRAAALAGLDPSVGIFEWSAEEDCALDDWDQIAQANPSLGYEISADAIRTSLATDPPNEFRTEVLCQQVDALQDVVDKAGWEHCKDARGNLSSVERGRLAVCFDAADNGAHATLVGAALMPDGRVRTAIIKAWRTTADADAELGPLLDELEPGLILWYPAGPAGELRPVFENRDNVEALAGAKQSAACAGLVGIVKARRIIHPGDPLQTAHVLGVRKIPVGDGYRFVRVISQTATGNTPGLAPSDAAYATAGAVYGAQAMPEPKRSGIRSMSA
jgi:hypothetical protein